MRTKQIALALAGFATVVVMTAATSADAQQRRRTVVTQTQRSYVVAPTPRSRITVYRRSFLDAGTEVLPGERKFTDYAIPPGYSPLSNHLGPSYGYDRRPLNDPFDLPGFGGHIAGF